MVPLLFIVVGVLYRVSLSEDWWVPSARLMHPLGMLTHFGMGSAAALILIRYGDTLKDHRGLLILVGCISIGLLVASVLRFHEYGDQWQKKRSMLLFFPFLITIPVAGLLIVCVSRDAALGSIFRWTPLPWLGRISYSLYIWHVPVMSAWRKGLGRIPEDSFVVSSAWASNIGMIVTVLLVSTWSYYMIEKPFFTRGQNRRSVPKPQ